MFLTRRAAIGFLGGASLLSSWETRAQAYPSRVVRVVVPYPAGGPTDAIARIVAQALAQPLGHNVIVENMAGASGALGARSVARAEPDGYTIVFGNNQSHGNNMFLLKEPGYDAQKDFAPLAGVGAFEHLFITRHDLGVSSVQELIALAKRDAGRLTYGSTGLGSGSHLSMQLFMQRTGIAMTHVPFRGAAQLVQEHVAGRLDVSNAPLSSVLGQVQGNQVRALAIASPQRNQAVPDVATLGEQGIVDADAESWTGFFAPAATPPAIVDRLSREILNVLGKSSVQEAIAKLGFTLRPRDATALRAYQASEMQVWAGIIQAAGIKLSD